MARKARDISSRTEQDLNRDVVGSSNEGFLGNYILNPKLDGVRLIYPDCWKGGTICFRPWPQFDLEDPGARLSPGRVDPYGQQAFRMLMMSGEVRIANRVGLNTTCAPELVSENRGVTYIIHMAKQDEVDGISVRDLPYPVLQKRLSKMKSKGIMSDGSPWNGAWNPLFESSGKDGKPAFSRAKGMNFIAGHVMHNGNKFGLSFERDRDDKKVPRDGTPMGLSDGDPLCVVGVSGSTARSLFKLWMTRAKGKEYMDPTEVENFRSLFKLKDPTGVYNENTGELVGGCFVTMFNPDTHENKLPFTSFSGEVKDFQGYEVAVTSKYPKNSDITASMSADQVDQIFNKGLWAWPPAGQELESENEDSLFRLPSIENRCKWLATAFAQVPKLLEQGWKENPEYWNLDVVQDVLQKGRKITARAETTKERKEAKTAKAGERKVASRSKKSQTTKPAASELADMEPESEEFESIDDLDTDAEMDVDVVDDELDAELADITADGEGTDQELDADDEEDDDDDIDDMEAELQETMDSVSESDEDLDDDDAELEDLDAEAEEATEEDDLASDTSTEAPFDMDEDEDTDLDAMLDDEDDIDDDLDSEVDEEPEPEPEPETKPKRRRRASSDAKATGKKKPTKRKAT